jgi:hypothetical protein
MTTQTLTTSLRENLIQRIEHQGFLPTSPGVLVDDKVVFCAGAAFIFEAAQNLKPVGSGLAHELLSNGTAGLRQKAADFDLDIRLIDQLISLNDSFSEIERKDKMCEFIRRLDVNNRAPEPRSIPPNS